MTRTPSRLALPHGLRWRLTAWVAAVLLLCAGALFAVVYRQTGAQLRGQIDAQIRTDAVELSQTLRTLRPATPARTAAAVRSYIASQPYAVDSPVLFTAVSGQPTVANHPEILGGESHFEPQESPADQRHEDREGRRLLSVANGYSTHQLPDIGPVRLYTQRLQLTGAQVLIGVGEPLELVERAQHAVARTFLLAGAVALVIALLASYLAGARVSAPLRRMAAVATEVDAGDLAPRMQVHPSRADEVQVLAEAFNHMLDRLQEAFAGQREFIADASHELRTPLTVIQGQLEVLAGQERPSSAEIRRVEALVRKEISRTSRLVDDLLLLARAERTDFLRPQTIDLHSFVADLWHGVTHMADRRFELGPVPEGALRADPDRLAQALRNLVRNAIEHTEPTSGCIRLELDALSIGRIRFAVVDDGPGIPAAERERVFERFHRTDTSRARTQGGTGLGLAIVRAIAEAHRGYVRALAAQQDRGARVELTVPGFRAH